MAASGEENAMQLLRVRTISACAARTSSEEIITKHEHGQRTTILQSMKVLFQVMR
jgi:hypothetical protein